MRFFYVWTCIVLFRLGVRATLDNNNNNCTTYEEHQHIQHQKHQIELENRVKYYESLSDAYFLDLGEDKKSVLLKASISRVGIPLYINEHAILNTIDTEFLEELPPKCMESRKYAMFDATIHFKFESACELESSALLSYFKDSRDDVIRVLNVETHKVFFTHIALVFWCIWGTLVTIVLCRCLYIWNQTKNTDKDEKETLLLKWVSKHMWDGTI